MKNTFKRFTVKAVGTVLLMCLLLMTLLTPLLLSANAEYDAETGCYRYGFEAEEGTLGGVIVSGVADYYGLGGDAFRIKSYGGSNVLQIWNPANKRTYATSGAFGINDKNGAYVLTAGHKYAVSFDCKVPSAIIRYSTMKDEAMSNVYLGYGITETEGADRATAKASKLKTNLYKFISCGIETEDYVSEQTSGTVSLPVSNDWRRMNFIINAPEDIPENSILGFYGYAYYGFECYIDNVCVTDLGTDGDYVIAVNVLTGEETYYTGKTGDAVPLKPFADVGTRRFKGWYNEDGTVEMSNISFGGANKVYGYFDGATEITCHDAVKGDSTISGQKDEKIVFPETAESEDGKKFIGWYLDPEYKTPFTDTVYGIKNLDIYALYSDKVTVTFNDTLNGKKETLEGYPTEPITLPEPIDGTHAATDKDCKLFVYWCTDSGLTKRFEGDGFPSVSTELYSKYESAPADLTVDFEHYTPGTSQSFTAFEIKSGVGTDGSKAGVFNGSSSVKSGYFLIGTVTPDRLYKFSYKYKVVKANGDFAIDFVRSTSVANYWENTGIDESNTVSVSKSIDSEWHTCEGYFVSSQYLKNDMLYTPKGVFLRIDNTISEADAEVIIDDVKLEGMSPVNTLVTLVGQNDDEFGTDGDVKYDINTVGEDIAFPEITFGERKLLGWALDADGRNMYTETKHGKESITLYAIWDRSQDPIAETFENYKHKPYNNYKQWQLTDEKAYRGAKSMKFTYNEQMYNEGVILQGLSASFPVMQLKDKTTYKIGIRYFVVKAGGSVIIKMATSTSGNIWDTLRNINYGMGFEINPDTKTGEWLYSEIYITTAFNSTETKTGNFLHFYTGVNTVADTVFYIDDITATPITGDEALIIFDDNNGGAGTASSGKAGKPISFPEAPEVFGKEFSYWAYDKAGTKQLDTLLYPAGVTTLYAVYDQAPEVKFTYEDYTFVSTKPGYAMSDCKVIETNKAYSGKKVVDVNRIDEYATGNSGKLNAAGARLALGNSKLFSIDRKFNYVIKFHYYINKKGNSNVKIKALCADTQNLWNKGQANTSLYTIYATESEGVWRTGYIALDFDTMENKNLIERTGMFLIVTGGLTGDYFFDDISLIRIPKNKSAVAIHGGDNDSVPGYIITNPGTSYQKQLPAKPTMKGYKFINYNYNGTEITDWTAPKIGLNIDVQWVITTTKQTFDNGYTDKINQYSDYSVMDFDYELYDSQKAGNSASNVTSGRYSLHRKGKTMFFENACLLSSGALSGDERYTVTFNVKMDSCLQTDGAVKIVSGKSSLFPWDVTGDYYPVIAIADLADGEWHKVSYTFNSVEAYCSVQTPGYCSIFIDDVTFTIVDDSVPLSEPVKYTEYVALERNEAGEIIDGGEINPYDVSQIVDDSLVPGGKKQEGVIVDAIEKIGDAFSEHTGAAVGVTAGIAAVIAAAVTFFILLAKKKKKKDKEEA